jgi:hypothetical protein
MAKASGASQSGCWHIDRGHYAFSPSTIYGGRGGRGDEGYPGHLWTSEPSLLISALPPKRFNSGSPLKYTKRARWVPTASPLRPDYHGDYGGFKTRSGAEMGAGEFFS